MNSLDAIKARLEAATPGPWKIIGGNEYLTGIDAAVGSRDEGGIRLHDAEFIANAPTDISRLLAAVEAATAALDKHGNPDPAVPGFGEFDAGYRAGRRALRAIVEQAIEAALNE